MHRAHDESIKLLGVKLTARQDWKEHVADMTSSCYATLSVLCKLKNFASFKLRKQLVESLALSTMDYCDTISMLWHNASTPDRNIE
jgi:hypothetical protein